MSYLKSSFNQALQHHKGYLSAAFLDPSSLGFDQDVEINYNHFTEPFSAPRHYHAKSKTWVLVLSGAMQFVVDSEAVSVSAGEYLIFDKGVTEEVTSVELGTTALTIHSPSIKGGDKVLIEKKTQNTKN